MKKIIQDKLKGRCSNCGKPIKEEGNENWKVYCTDKKCTEAFYKSIAQNIK